MTAASVLEEATHLTYDLLGIVEDTYRREILINPRNINRRQIHIILINNALFQPLITVLNILNHACMYLEAVLATTFVSVRCNKRIIVIFYRI